MTSQEFEHIASVLRPRLKDIGKQFFGDNDVTEDIVQEVLMRLWILRERINPMMGTEALAVRMTKNLCVSEWRSRKVRQATSLKAAIPSDDNLQQNVELKEDITQLHQAVCRLQPTEQRLFRMRYEAEMDIGQITAVTGIGARSVSSMLSTAKRKLQEILTKKGGKQ
jgi:RNA polymerase sigma factor (sigma-70 family)